MRFIFIAGLIFFIGSFFLIPNSLKKFEVGQHGTIVKMKIEEMPSSCIGTKVRYQVVFSYNSKRYEKQTRGGFCEEHYIGELVDIKMLPGEDTILWAFDSGLGDILSVIGLGLFGLGVSIAVVVKNWMFKREILKMSLSKSRKSNKPKGKR
ncbi:hypothetical protein [Chitinophaga nivalis]|uniref:DUF3592 domain-containing protein n=1 Tax=Chitinophaga nivalis TaxID=2991709 RepID=A0ABT3IEH8_9BACT|nr:hypothetical protein [Chitinophaga nivalis]MCW3467947.1 hypothetical protein [Chitinophaga nivalis]MCW3482362.1 hypothetical protein [Chitinophaga nivalis]